MVLEIIGLTFDVIGKILLGITVISVHTQVMKERRIDKKVINRMQVERKLVIIGLALIIVGYIMQLLAKTVWW